MTEETRMILDEIRSLKTDVSDMKADMAEMKTDISNLKADMAEMKTDISGMKEEIRNINVALENDISKRIDIMGTC